MSGLQTTFDILAATKNNAANDLLMEGLDSADRGMRELAFDAILKRRNSPCHHELIRRWGRLSERWKSKIADKPGRVSAAVRDAIMGADEEVRDAGFEAVVWLREYDLIPALINAIEDAANTRRAEAADALVQLCELLYEDLAVPRDYQQRRDPQIVRKHVVASLQASVDRFEQHQQGEIVEAFLLLARRENSLLRSLLDNVKRRAYKEIVGRLLSGSRPGVNQLLLDYMEDVKPPIAALHVLARRCDVPFMRRLFKSLNDEFSETARRNISRIDRIAWLDQSKSILSALNEEEQATAVRFVAASNVNRERKIAFLRQILVEALPAARRAAAEVLDTYQGSDVNALVLEALGDDDPHVQAKAIFQLRDRGIPGAMTRLIGMIDSAHREVRDAAHECLGEFNFQRFIAAFDMLEEDVRWSTGELVKRIDPSTLEELVVELDSPSRIRKLRALKAAPMVDAANALLPRILEFLGNDDHFVRAEAANSLGYCTGPTVRSALDIALQDRSSTVREAAHNAIERMQKALSAPSASMAAMDDWRAPPLTNKNTDSNEPTPAEAHEE